MLKSFSFPSVYEATNKDFPSVAGSLIDGIKIKFDGDDYIIGNLAMQEGFSPHKAINSSPAEFEYQLLSQAALMFTGASAEDEAVVTVGFPFSTYRLYKDAAKELLSGKHTIEVDTSVYGGNGYVKREVSVGRVDVIPEIVGCATAVREGDLHEKGSFFMVSLGFGTFEAVLSTPSGLVSRTSVSAHGIRHAVNMFADELSKTLYLNLKTEHQLDAAFIQGKITSNRVKHDVLGIRREVLRMYYNDVISPNLRRAFTDDDFSKSNRIYLAGGGAHYQELVECFNEEFGSILTVEVYPEPEKCASHGYCLNSQRLASVSQNVDFEKMDAESFMKSGRSVAAGIDMGNANTCVTVYTEGD